MFLSFVKIGAGKAKILLMGINKITYIRAWTVKPHDILKVKNGLVKSAYYVTHCAVSNLRFKAGIL